MRDRRDESDRTNGRPGRTDQWHRYDDQQEVTCLGLADPFQSERLDDVYAMVYQQDPMHRESCMPSARLQPLEGDRVCSHEERMPFGEPLGGLHRGSRNPCLLPDVSVTGL